MKRSSVSSNTVGLSLNGKKLLLHQVRTHSLLWMSYYIFTLLYLLIALYVTLNIIFVAAFHLFSGTLEFRCLVTVTF